MEIIRDKWLAARTCLCPKASIWDARREMAAIAGQIALAHDVEYKFVH